MAISAGGIQEAEAEQAGPSQPTATQAEEAQGFESAQEELTQPEAPLAADSNQSRVKATRGRGRGRGRGRSSRPAADRKSDGTAVAGEIRSCRVLDCSFALQSVHQTVSGIILGFEAEACREEEVHEGSYWPAAAYL